MAATRASRVYLLGIIIPYFIVLQLSLDLNFIPNGTSWIRDFVSVVCRHSCCRVWMYRPEQNMATKCGADATNLHSDPMMIPVISYIQCESNKNPPPRGPDIFSFFSQTVENL